MRPVPYNVNKFWPMLRECTLATLTCLFDGDFWRDWWKHTYSFFGHAAVFLIRLLVTLTFPVSSLLITFAMLRHNRKIKAEREKANKQTHEGYFKSTQKQ